MGNNFHHPREQFCRGLLLQNLSALSTSAPAKNDFGNQLLLMQRLKRTKIANCALLCPLFIICWRIRLTRASAKTNEVYEFDNN